MSAVLFRIVSLMDVCKHLVPLVQRSACIYDSGAHGMFVLHKFYVVHLLNATWSEDVKDPMLALCQYCKVDNMINLFPWTVHVIHMALQTWYKVSSRHHG